MEDSDLVALLFTAALGFAGVIGAFAVRRSRRKERLETHGRFWQEAARAVDSGARVFAKGADFTIELQHEGVALFVRFAEHVHVGARVPAGLAVALPPGGRIPGIAQRIEWFDGAPAVRVGLERHASLPIICAALAPVMRQAIAAAGRVDVGPAR